MYLRVGAYTRPFNEVNVDVSYQPVYDAKKRIIQVIEDWAITGRIVLQTNATQAAMSQAINLLKRDFEQTRPDLLLIEDDGITPTPLQLLASESVDGPIVTARGFPNNPGNVYATGLSYFVNVRSTRLQGTTASNPIVSFQETLEMVQGGEVRGFVGGAVNLPELQTFKQSEAYIYVQSGSAVGLYGWVDPPLPLWPYNQLRQNRPKLISPQNSGVINTHYETIWSYEMGSVYPLTGIPHELT